jgi:hypothetical protein
MKELSFSTERPKGPDNRDQVELPINGDVYFAYRPSTNSIATFYAAQGKRSVAVKLAAVDTFLEKNLEPEAYALITRAMEIDALEYEDLIDLVLAIIEEFAENPPTSSSGSSRSPRATGAASTASSRRPASTRATSRSRASSAPSTGGSRET